MPSYRQPKPEPFGVLVVVALGLLSMRMDSNAAAVGFVLVVVTAGILMRR